MRWAIQRGGEPLRAKHMCDKKCNEEGFRFYDIAAVVTEDDGKPHTINLCRDCYNLRLAERTESIVTSAGWKAMIEQKFSLGKLSAALGTDGFVNRMWERYAVKKRWASKLEEATQAVQLETSSWQNESPYKEEHELLRVSSDMRLEAIEARKADWSELEDVPEAAVREGADELTLRRGDQLRVLSSIPPRWWTVDGDRRWWRRIGTPFVQAIYKGSESEEWERLYCTYVDMHKATIRRQRLCGC